MPVARSVRSRLLGLAFLARDAVDAGLLIPRCRSIHTFGMRFELDILFLDPAGQPVRLIEGLAPRRFASERRAASVLEFKGGTFRSAGVDLAMAAKEIDAKGARDGESE